MKKEQAKRRAVVAIRMIVQAAKELAAAERAYRKHRRKAKPEGKG